MADQDRTTSSDDDAARNLQSPERQGDQSQDENNEWVRDQVGEDRNLSGSTTFRTLPDQPGTDSGARDAKDRQSNR